MKPFPIAQCTCIFVLTNVFMVDSKVTNGTEAKMYASRPTQISEDVITNTFKDFSVVACALSCSSSINCYQAALKKTGSQQDCLHLKQMKIENGFGNRVKVELLEDTIPGSISYLVKMP